MVIITLCSSPQVAEAQTTLQYGEELELDKVLPSPPDGVLVHGLFTDGCRWDDDEMVVADSLHGEMNGTSQHQTHAFLFTHGIRNNMV